MRPIAAVMFTALILSCIAGCTLSHEYGPYFGKVVDAETKEPIEGAVVLVVFYTEKQGLTVEQSKYVDATEVVTDKNGDFWIPEKRIFAVRMLHWWNPHGYFTIFKPGYGCYPTHKDAQPIFVPNGSLPSNHHLTVELPKLRTLAEREAEGLPTVSGSVPYERQQKLVEMINREREFLGYPGKIERKAWE